MASNREKAAAKAREQYKEVTSTGSIGDLLSAVKAASQAKSGSKKKGKRELKAVASAAKLAAAAAAEERVARLQQEALAAEIARIAEQQKFDEDQARKALQRERREKALAEGRARQAAAITKVRQLKHTMDQELRAAQMGPVSQTKIRELLALQVSLESAFNALPAKFQSDDSRAAVNLNREILVDLAEIAKKDAEEESAKKKFAKNYNIGYMAGLRVGNKLRPVMSKSSALAASLVGKARDVASSLAAAPGAASATMQRYSSASLVQARRLTSAIGTVGANLGKLGSESREWFTKKFGSMFSKLWRLIRNPSDLLKSGGSLLSKAIGWGALFSGILAPMLGGLYEELKRRFGPDFISKAYDNAKEWLYNKITTWFENFFRPAKEKAAELVGKAKNALGMGEGLAKTAGTNQVAEAAQKDKAFKDAGLKINNIPLSKLASSYKSYKEAGNPLTRQYYRWGVESNLAAVKPETIPTVLANQLKADGFSVPTGGKSAAPPAVKATPAPAKNANPVVGGAPADGQGTKPVVATPKAPSSSKEATGASQGFQGSPGGLTVSQIPRTVIDDANHGFNLGMFGA